MSATIWTTEPDGAPEITLVKILTGTPAGVGRLRDGDVVEAEVEGIGVLRNVVQAGQQG